MKGRRLLMIPGPIEFGPEVLSALGSPTTSHVDPEFIELFAQTLERMRAVWRCPSGQPFILAGSGTLAMDAAGANLVESGDKALVLSTGVFGDRFAELLARYGANVTVITAPLGETINPEQVESALRHTSYKLMTFTHVDTSTGVWVDPRPLGRLGREYGVLTVLDGVCSIGGVELDQEAWGIDIALTASQKAIGVPPGLALVMAGPEAISAWTKRTRPVGSYYTDWSHWLPVMAAYEARRPSYFATPAVNLVCALNVGLGQIITEGLAVRIARHQRLGAACQAAISALGLGQIPTDPGHAAATMTAPRYPAGVTGEQLLPRVRAAGVILASGLHPMIKSEYFRIGHMGAAQSGDILAVIGALEEGLLHSGYQFSVGTGVAAAQARLRAP